MIFFTELSVKVYMTLKIQFITNIFLIIKWCHIIMLSRKFCWFISFLCRKWVMMILILCIQVIFNISIIDAELQMVRRDMNDQISNIKHLR